MTQIAIGQFNNKSDAAVVKRLDIKKKYTTPTRYTRIR